MDLLLLLLLPLPLSCSQDDLLRPLSNASNL